MTKKTEYFCLLIFFIGLILISWMGYCSQSYATEIDEAIAVQQFSIQDIKNAKADGYTNITKWKQQISKVKSKYKNTYKKEWKKYKKYMSKSQKTKVKKYAAKVNKAKTIIAAKKNQKKINKIFKAAKKKKLFKDKESGRVTITRSGGVYYYGGRLETYYSSNVLYHYMTPQWVCDSQGFWRTKDGYYVVACSDKSQGSVFRGSKGMCKVLDSGCMAGTTDYYVAW